VPVVTESRYLSFHGLRTHFRVVPPDEDARRHVFLLCSPAMTAFHWRKLLPELNDGHTLLVLSDFPEFGRSECPFRVTRDWDTQASILWGILDDVDRSFGAPLSMWHMIAHGSACRALCAMLRQSPDSVCSQVYISPLLASVRDERLRRVCSAPPDDFRRAALWLAGYDLEDYVLDKTRESLLRQGMQTALDDVLRRELPPENVGGFCPAMVVRGARDPLFDARQQRAEERALPDAERHILKSAGHFPMETHSRALRDYLRGWILYNE